MSGYVEYDEQDFIHEGESPAQLAARRTRRRRRHGKKQGSTDGYMPGVGRPSEDYRGRWMPPPSATTLTLAQLGIHVAPPPRIDGQASMTLAKLGLHFDPPPSKPMVETASRNVVTWSDLDLVNCTSECRLRTPGALDHYAPAAPPQPLQRPQLWLNGATSPFHCEEQSCDRILSAPSPQVALHMAEQVHYPTEQLPPVFVAPRPSQHLPIQPIQSQPATWSEPDPGLRHWLCSGQYGAQPIFNSPLGSSSGMALASAPLCTAAPAPGWAGVTAPSVPAPTSPMAKAPTSPMGKVPTSPIAKQVAKKIAEEDKLQAEKKEAAKLEGQKLETLLENLAAEVYQD